MIVADLPLEHRSRWPACVHRIAACVVVALAALITGCASLPSLEGRSPTTALADTAGTLLGRALAPQAAAHPGKTGIHPFRDPRDAFAARVLLAAVAERSLDVQYYQWNGDQVGYLLFDALWRAAERGVRVRLLLDDVGTAGLDPTIAALDAHPNIEVRLYNPVAQRDVRALNFLTDFTRVNRRMHNKSFTADNQASVVGGRNIGNEYFGAGSGVVFADLDVIAVGAAVREVSSEFDLYWNSISAYPAASLVGLPGPDGTAGLVATFASTRADPDSVAYLDAVRTTSVVRDVIERKLAFEWTTAKVVYDDPAKTLDTTNRTDILLFPELVRSTGRPETAFDLVSPYFVPGEDGTAALVALAGRGVKVRILTNSLASTDVSAVHAGYAKRRRDLLRGGVELFELKATVAHDTESTYKVGSSSSAGLHAKTFAVDRSRIFVGSFNFDQRSARINTEMGLVIASSALARELAGAFDVNVPPAAYEVRLAPDGRLEWIERTALGEKRYDTEPETTWLLRSKVDLLSILPIEWLL
ncbi:MAG TPA: phospholipase D family protein [Casimicrobiaceae bacterium]|nr:phospholipase D family protein [Casimicrobiaceae bacterium]